LEEMRIDYCAVVNTARVISKPIIHAGMKLKKINHVMRSVSTEPKALMLEFMLKNRKLLQPADLTDAIALEYSLPGLICTDRKHITGLLQRSFRDVIMTRLETNTRSGRRWTNVYNVDKRKLRLNPKIPSHALYASAIISAEQDGYSNYELLNPSSVHENVGMPGRVSIILNALNEYGRLTIQNLIDVTGIDNIPLKDHLKALKDEQYLDFIRNRSQKYSIAEYGVQKYDLVKDTLPFRVATRVVLESIINNPGQDTESVQTKLKAYGFRYVSAILKNLKDAHIVEPHTYLSDDEVTLSDKGSLGARYLVNPILRTIEGDDSLLKTPTDKQRLQALQNYEKYRF